MPLGTEFLHSPVSWKSYLSRSWSSPYPPSFLNWLPSGVCPHHSSRLLPARPGHHQRTCPRLYLCLHPTIWHHGHSAWKDFFCCSPSLTFSSGPCPLVFCRSMLYFVTLLQRDCLSRPVLGPLLSFSCLVSYSSSFLRDLSPSTTLVPTYLPRQF